MTESPAPITGVAPGWYADPTGHYQFRYWDGVLWTEHVSDEGQTGVELLPAPEPVPESPVPGAGSPTAPSHVVALRGPVSFKLKNKGFWSMPPLCVACGGPAVATHTFSGSSLNQKRTVKLDFPVCASCQQVIEHAGHKLFTPKEVRPQYKRIRRAVKMVPDITFSKIRFTFQDGAFGGRFRELNS